MFGKYFCQSLTLLTALSLSLSAQSQEVAQDFGDAKVYELLGSPEFSNAELQLATPLNEATLKEGENTFDFTVKNFQLGAQTPDAGKNMCANSSKGQHIHFIMDNAPYVASYSPKIVSDMKPGHHVLLAFLSRSYHESIKTKKAHLIREFNVGPDAKDDFNEKAPHIFFSRPKGEYVGENENRKIMLDFYLINCNLSPKGYKVRATVDDKEFMLTKWAPYIIEGLKFGGHKVKLELLDKDNKLVKSPFNGVERSFNLTIDMTPPKKN
ncbi:MAG: phosphopeptide-binding protein [Bacteroidota bacterium]